MKIVPGNEQIATSTRSADMRLRIPIIIAVAIVLIAALWTALIRVGWELPSAGGVTAIQHGALMVSGFLGTLISLERAVALKRRWTYLGPACSALGAILIILGFPPLLGQVLIVLAGFCLTCVFNTIYRMHPSLDTGVMGFGALLWLVGNILWAANQPIFHSVPWWAAFLILTIAGERLELSRVLRPSQRTKAAFIAVVSLIGVGLIVSLISFTLGVQISGLGLVCLAIWLMINDIARRTIRKTGLTRFIAACLLPGYVWMAIGGLLWVLDATLFVGGMAYDAMLHTFFLGFVFSMIFGHAPIILPAVVNVPVIYSPRFYYHLTLLHISLVLRIVGDLTLISTLQHWGGLLNVCAVLLFLGSTLLATRQPVVNVAEHRVA
jgi:hypothetical protein